MTAGAFLGVERSLSGRKWLAREVDDGDVSAIARILQAPEPLARVLAGRGVTPEAAPGFMTPKLRDHFPDPSGFQDMDRAAALIWEAIEKGRGLAVFADYDVDGASSAAQIIRYLRRLGVACDLYVPDRIAEGYGPNAPAFKALKARGAELVITVDCGAAAQAPIEAAREIGLDVVVVDHHLMDGDFPPASALVNPNRPDDSSGCGHLAAAGVSFVLLAALNREGRRRGAFETRPEPDLLELIDLAALGTICDVVPLTGVNRAITAQGLKAMGGWRHAGLKALAEVAGVSGPASAYHAGFLLGPRINAGGRVGQAELGARLLSTDDAEEAAEIAAALDGFNAERRTIEAQVLDAARADIVKGDETAPILVAAGPGWHPGVIGVAAGRLKEEFGRPVFVIGVDAAGLGKGSGRSVPGVNLGAAVTAAREQGLLEAGGGHAMAAGLSVREDRIEALTAFLQDHLAGEFATAGDAMAMKLDGVLTPAGASQDLIEMLEQAGPFGQGNSSPRFAFADLRAAYAERVGGMHVRFALEDRAGESVRGIAFRVADTPVGQALLAGGEQRFHAAGRLKIDEWRGRKKVDFQLEDLAAAEKTAVC
jgi:single-stranded-DNA-specific exonuclease